jgi:hypothetical protein
MIWGAGCTVRDWSSLVEFHVRGHIATEVTH